MVVISRIKMCRYQCPLGESSFSEERANPVGRGTDISDAKDPPRPLPRPTLPEGNAVADLKTANHRVCEP